MCYHDYQLPHPHNGRKICTKFVRLWVGLSKQFPVLAVSVSQLCTVSHACF